MCLLDGMELRKIMRQRSRSEWVRKFMPKFMRLYTLAFVGHILFRIQTSPYEYSIRPRTR